MLPVGQIWGKKCRRHQVMPVAAAAADAYVQHGSSSVAGGRLIDWADTSQWRKDTTQWRKDTTQWRKVITQ